MKSRLLPLVIAVLALPALLALSLAADDNPPPTEEPRDVGLIEKTGRRLLQVDVTVLGPPRVVDALTAEDFEVEVGGKLMRDILVDRVCATADAPPIDVEPADEANVAAAKPEVMPPGVSYLFYFDQHHLTMAGRQRALDLSRELIDKMIRGANRAMIVSSGQEVRTFAELTSDREVLLDALGRLENDKTQWDPYATQEDGRVEEIYSALGLGLDAGQGMANSISGGSRGSAGAFGSIQATDQARGEANRNAGKYSFGGGGSGLGRAGGALDRQQQQQMQSAADAVKTGASHAKITARQYQREERWLTEKALSRFSMVLGRLAEVNPPKAVIYFADRMRSNAGDHYIGIFGKPKETDSIDARDPTLQVLSGANLPIFDQLIDEAAANGVRLFTVQAEGLVLGISGTRIQGSSARFLSSDPLASSKRFKDAQNSLVGLARETGGEAFLNGVGANKIAKQIESDLACVYLISFDPAGLPEDRRLSLAVRVRKPRVETQARARVVVQSDSARLVSRLTTAFSDPGQVSSSGRLRAVVIPTGYQDGQYTALVQLVVPGGERSGATWDLGLLGLSGGKVRQQASQRISVPESRVPVVFENSMRFVPGPYELVAVAHDVVRDEIITTRSEGIWPEPPEEGATVGPIALLQPANGVFVREDEHRTSGALGRGDDEWIRPDRPAALLAVVCRSKKEQGPLDVDRELQGESVAGFPPLTIGADEENCFLLSDLIPAGTMSEGEFNYAVSVREEDVEIASAARGFTAILPEKAAESASGP